MKTLLFVDDEPRVLQGLQRQLHPMRGEWQMHFVDSGFKALEFMSGHAVDIIVSDMMMPGMDGAQLLGEVLKLHPQTVRIILSGHSEREAALRLVGPAHQYLSKPCEADELRQTILRAFSLRDLLGNERLKHLTTRIRNLPTLSNLQDQLANELRKDAPSMEVVGEIISRDVGMTAKILQLVNSAFFGLAQPIDTPAEAVTYLGVNTIRSLVLSLEIFSGYGQGMCPHFSLDSLARHSWVAGNMARTVAQSGGITGRFVNQCFLAGLLHDVGQMVLAFGLAIEYTGVIERAAREKKPIWEIEREVFGATHADVGAYLLALWGLPDSVVEAVALHHHPCRSAAGGFSPAVAVHVADVFAHEYLAENTEAPPLLDLPCLTQIGCAGQIETWRAQCRPTNPL
jgi:HD-like signal output (HDOD) protein